MLEVDLAAEVALAAVDMVLDLAAAVADPAQGGHQGAQDSQVLVLEVDLVAEVALAAVVVGAVQDRRAAVDMALDLAAVDMVLDLAAVDMVLGRGAVDMVLDLAAAVADPAQGDHQGAPDSQVLVRVQAAAKAAQVTGMFQGYCPTWL